MASSSYWDEKWEALYLKRVIEKIIEALDKHHRNVNISRVTGSSVAIATGGTAAGLAIAAPFTLGVTLIPAIVLGIVSGVSGAVSVGASVTGHFIKKHNVKEVQMKWERFRDRFRVRHRVAEAENINAEESGRVASPLLDALRFIALPLDFVDMVTAAHSLNTGEESPASKSLKKIISFLDKVINGEFDYGEVSSGCISTLSLAMR